MKKLLLGAILVLALASCKENSGRVYVQDPQTSNQDIVVTPTSSNVGDNLDLQSLGELVKQSNSAQEIEQKLNSNGSINNLDLNGDGEVDYIKVNESNDTNGKGFIFLVDTPQGSEQVATITLSQNGDMGSVNIQGNPTYYGSTSYYTSNHLVRDMMIMNYLYSGYHRPYYSPYRYGHYPSNYRSYRSIPYSSYQSSPIVVSRTTTTRTTRPSSNAYSNTKSSYGNSSYKARPVTPASERTRSLASPTTSQKSFKATSPSNSRPSTSGFGNSSKSSSRPSSSYSSSSSKPSSSSRSSFGSSSRSSSSSSRSSRH